MLYGLYCLLYHIRVWYNLTTIFEKFVGIEEERDGNCHDEYESMRACWKYWRKRILIAGETCQSGMRNCIYGQKQGTWKND